MKFIKVYKWLLLLFLVLLITIMFFVKDFWFYDNKSSYGNRLEGIENITIESDLKNDIINSFVELDDVNSVSINVRGKIVNIIIDVAENINIENGKKIANDVLIKFSDEQKSFYDIQFYITQEVSSGVNGFPIIGYKNKTSEVIAWNLVKGGINEN